MIKKDFYKLPFLGERNYLHGTTLLNFLENKITPYSNYTFKIFNIIYTNQILITNQEIHDRSISAQISWNYKNNKDYFIDPVESKFWYNTSKKECYFKKDRGIKYVAENVG